MTRGIKLMRVSFVINAILLGIGLAVCIIDLQTYAFGLYLVLVAIVGLIISFAFCIMGPEGAEETVAKKMWNRMSMSASRRDRVSSHKRVRRPPRHASPAVHRNEAAIIKPILKLNDGDQPSTTFPSTSPRTNLTDIEEKDTIKDSPLLEPEQCGIRISFGGEVLLTENQIVL